MTSVHAISHVALKWKISQPKWNYLGARAGGLFQGRSYILYPKICPSLHAKNTSNKRTHIYTHTIKSLLQFHHQWLSVLHSKSFTHQTATVSRCCSYKVKRENTFLTRLSNCVLSSFFNIPLEAILRQVSRGFMFVPAVCCSVCIIVSLPAEMLIW